MQDMVLILNNNSFFAKSIAIALRSEKIYCRVVPGNLSAAQVEAERPLGIILAGGLQEKKTSFDPQLLCMGLPVLALGNAASELCRHLGGTAEKIDAVEQVETIHYEQNPLFETVTDGERYMNRTEILTLPQAVHPIALIEDQTVIGFAHETLPVYGLLFQVEKNDPDSLQILFNFAHNICGCNTWWDNQAFISQAVEDIRQATGDGCAIGAISGGIDSGVSALLGHKALGNRMTALFIDTGLLRSNEQCQVLRVFRDEMGLNVKVIDAHEAFLFALSGITDNQRKLEVINALLEQTLKNAYKESGASVILTGTNCSDIILEQTIHQNEPEEMKKLLPVKELFKEEIRQIGSEMGLPEETIYRQSFPGTGLARRIMGEVTEEKLGILRTCDAIFREEIENANQQKKLYKYYAELSPAPEGEKQTLITLRAVNNSGTATAARLSYDLLETVVSRIQAEAGIPVRIAYDLTPSSHKESLEWV